MQTRCGSSIPAERASKCTTNVSERRGGDNSQPAWGRVCSECGGRMEIGWDGARCRGGVGARSGIVQSGRAFETRSPFLVLCRVEGGLLSVGWRRGAGRRVLKSVEEWRYFIGMAVVLTGIHGLLDGDDFRELLFVGGGRGFMDYWMGMILGNCFLSAEDAEGRGEWQLLFVRGGRGGTRRTATAFFPRRTRRDAENGNCFFSTEDTEEHGERQHLFFRGGREGTRRTATAFFPRRTRRDAENGNCFFPRRARRTSSYVV